MTKSIHITYDESCRDADYEDSIAEENWQFFVFGAQIKHPEFQTVFSQQIDIDFEPQVGQKVYVLSVQYLDERSNIIVTGKGDIVWIFQDEDAAGFAKNSIDWAITQPTYVFLNDAGEAVEVISNFVGENGRSIYRTTVTELTIGE